MVIGLKRAGINRPKGQVQARFSNQVGVVKSGVVKPSIEKVDRGAFIVISSKKRFAQKYQLVYDMEPVDRSDMVETGVPAAMLTWITHDMGVTKDKLVKVTGLSMATVNRKIASNSNLSLSESDRLVGLAKLIGQVESIVKESGRPEGFNAAKWFSDWIEQPAKALGGRKPENLLATADGREAVSTLLSQMQSGAYA